MPMLVVKCPATGEDLKTGLEMSKDDFKTADIFPRSVRCPYCERDHTWYKSDLFFMPSNKAAS